MKVLLRRLIVIGKAPRGSVFLDTNVVASYIFRERSRFETARRSVKSFSIRGISIITIHELYSLALRFGVADRFSEAKKLIEKAFRVHQLTQEVCIKAAELRQSYRLPEVDSLILATAIVNKYSEFHTFDNDFEDIDGREIEGTKIVYLRTHASSQHLI